MPRAQKGQRFGGRQKGDRNKATIAREELARAQIAEAMTAAKTTKDVRYAITEMQKALAIAEGLSALLQPKSISKDESGKLVIVGGDMKLFGEWFDRYFNIMKELGNYQAPRMKAIEAPAPPPDPGDLERKARKRFGLRVFEGGGSREIRPASDPGDE